MEIDKDLVKIHIDLPEHWSSGGESMWAKPLGDDLYEVRNVPFNAYGLNFADVVYAVAHSPDLKPSVIEVKKRSGHQTLRVIFEKNFPEDQRAELLKTLNKFKAFHENANNKLFAIDIELGGNYEAVYDQLQEWQNQEILSFETCDFRVEGRFDLDYSDTEETIDSN